MQVYASNKPFASHGSNNREEMLAIPMNGRTQSLGISCRGALSLCLWEHSDTRAAGASLQSQGTVSKSVSQKCDYTFWAHLHFPGCCFLHLSFQQQAHWRLSPLHRIFSCFSQSDVWFYFLFFPSIQPPSPQPPQSPFCAFATAV